VKGAAGCNGWGHWGPLIVLDAGQFSTRCRYCGWRSRLCDAVGDAQAGFRTHTCSTDAVGCSAIANRRPTATELPRAGRTGLAVARRLPAGTGVGPTSL
jgi:hypothetical protein